MNHIYEIDQRGVATLTLNRPEVRNAFNGELIAEVIDRLQHLTDEVRVLVLQGAGKMFCSGADLGWMMSLASSSSGMNDSNVLQSLFDALDTAVVPVVTRVHGAALAGATGLLACSDVVVAEESAAFAFTEVRLGLIPAVISPYVVRKTGYSFARAAFLTAEKFSARRAYEAGLVHVVATSDGLDAAVERVVGDLLAGAPEAQRLARRLVDEVHGKPPTEVAAYTTQAIADRRRSEEGQEGIASFLEKRKPNWAP